MRRSSWGILVAALAVVAAVAWLYPDTAAGPMSPAVARSIVRSGQAALTRRDLDGLMELFTPNARIMGRPAPALREALSVMLAEARPGSLSAEVANVTVAEQGGTVTMKADLAVNHKLPEADVVYFRAKLTAELVKSRTTRLWGLVAVERWRISRLDSYPPISLPEL